MKTILALIVTAAALAWVADARACGDEAVYPEQTEIVISGLGI